MWFIPLPLVSNLAFPPCCLAWLCCSFPLQGLLPSPQGRYAAQAPPFQPLPYPQMSQEYQHYLCLAALLSPRQQAALSLLAVHRRDLSVVDLHAVQLPVLLQGQAAAPPARLPALQVGPFAAAFRLLVLQIAVPPAHYHLHLQVDAPSATQPLPQSALAHDRLALQQVVFVLQAPSAHHPDLAVQALPVAALQTFSPQMHHSVMCLLLYLEYQARYLALSSPAPALLAC
mmetsp:Transcript_33683/g.66270  ORF Transcript_33683/g.66270 Transcript_33683/m.66270 type:complete len:229 (+) Transcript_33683:92-778(+)